MPESQPSVLLVGYFPPDLNGQTLATQALADVLDGHVRLRTFNMLRYSHPTSKVRRTVGYLRMMRALRRALRDAPEAVVVWGALAVTQLGHWRDLLTVLPLLRGRRVVAVMHRAQVGHLFAHPLTRRSMRRLVRHVRRFVFLSDELSQRCAAWLPAASRAVIPNIIGQALWCSQDEVEAKQAEAPHRPLRILYFSLMLPAKGYLDLLEACVRLHRAGVAFQAVFAGGWPQGRGAAALAERIEAYGLQDVVQQTGPVLDRATAKAWHLAADVFVLPSYHPTETLPVAILEAMNAGTPVVTTQHGSLPAMIGEAGRAVPIRDPDALATAIAELAHPVQWQAVSRHARRRFDERYSPDVLRARWLRLLREVAAE